MAASSEVVTGKLMTARRSLRGTEWDGTYLDHFVQVLCRLDADRHGFAVEDLQAIEGAWVDESGEAWSDGFVARLKDGRRAHADGRTGRSHWSEDADIDAGLLDASEPIPSSARAMAGRAILGTKPWCVSSTSFSTGSAPDRRSR